MNGLTRWNDFGSWVYRDIYWCSFGRHSSCVIWPNLTKGEWELLEISSCGMILVSGYILDSHILLLHLTLEVIVFFHVVSLANCSTRLFLVVASMPGECFTVHSIFQSLHWLVGSYHHTKSGCLEHPLGSGWSKCVSDMQWGRCFFDPNMCCKSWWHFKRYLFGICLQQQESKWGKCERFRTPWKLNKIQAEMVRISSTNK